MDKHFKPICNKITPATHSVTNSKAMIREMGNVELFELCETIPKVQCTECLLYWNQGIVHCTCGHLLFQSESIHKLITNGGCMLSQSRTTSSKWSDLVVLGTAKRKQKKAVSYRPQCAEEMSQKKITVEFTIASNEMEHIVISNSKLVGQRRSASRWISWHKKTIPIAHPLSGTRETEKTGRSH